MLCTDIVTRIIEYTDDLSAVSNLLQTCYTYYSIYYQIPKVLTNRFITKSQLLNIEFGLDRLLSQNQKIRHNLNIRSVVAALIHYAKNNNYKLFDLLRFDISQERIEELTTIEKLLHRNISPGYNRLYNGETRLNLVDPRCLRPKYYQYIPIYFTIIGNNVAPYKRSIVKNIETITIDIIQMFGIYDYCGKLAMSAILIQATKNNRLDLAKYILKSESYDVDYFDSRKPMNIAIMNNNITMAELLIEYNFGTSEDLDQFLSEISLV